MLSQALARDQDFAASAVAKWWDGRDRDWVRGSEERRDRSHFVRAHCHTECGTKYRCWRLGISCSRWATGSGRHPRPEGHHPSSLPQTGAQGLTQTSGPRWAYAALWELMSNFECTARNMAKIIAAELNVDEGSRVLKRRADGSFRAHNMEVFLVPESAEEQWKGLSDELAAVRALWRCRCYYFVPVSPLPAMGNECGKSSS